MICEFVLFVHAIKDFSKALKTRSFQTSLYNNEEGIIYLAQR